MTKSDSLIKKIAENSIIAAIYFVLTIAIPVFQYGDIQFRVAEFLVLLCFWRPDFVFGVTLGCFLANFGSPMGAVDVLMGTAATLISSLMVAYLSPRLLLGVLYPIIANGFVVGFELSWILGLPFWPSVGTVSLGEGVVIIASYFLWMSLSHNKGFMRAINPTRHQDVHW
jgi:Predicted membrane protein